MHVGVRDYKGLERFYFKGFKEIEGLDRIAKDYKGFQFHFMKEWSCHYKQQFTSKGNVMSGWNLLN